MFNQSFNFSNPIIQLIVFVFGIASYLPFIMVTPYFALLILYLFGQYVDKSSWISDQLKECIHGNIREDSPTRTQRLSYNVIFFD
jgi:hypothetical protein